MSGASFFEEKQMRKVAISEATLSLTNSMSFKEKLEAARLMDALGIDVIEMPAPEGDKADEILIKTIAAQTRKSVISVPVNGMNLENAWNCVKDAVHPRLNVKLPVSVPQMEYYEHLKAPKMLDKITAVISKAKELCADVEFTALDASRAESEFLASAVNAAIGAGAATVTLSDEEGTMLPGESGAFVANIIEKCAAQDITIGIRVCDTFSMAEACAFEAVRSGAGLVYTACEGGVLPSLKIFARVMNAKGENSGIYCDIDGTALERTVETVASYGRMHSASGACEKQSVAAAPATTIDFSTDIQTVSAAASQLGYDLSEEDLAKVYENVRAVTAKKSIGNKELDAIIASAAMQVPPTFTLSSYVVNSGNVIAATAHVVLDKNGETVQGLSTGDGPIDAALMAIEKSIGHHYELDDFSIQSVTSGQDSMGEALVRLRDEGKLYSGRGISTDIVGASIRAYLNALNKIIYKG